MKKRILALTLALLLTANSLPGSVLAEEISETTAPTEQTLPAETTCPPVTTEATEPQTVPEDTQIPETTQETTQETTSETTEPTEIPETTGETEEPPEETLPYGLAGLPEDYVLTSQEQADKADMAAHQVAQEAASYQAGEQYEADTLLIWTETEETARIYARAFCAELEYWQNRLGCLRLKDIPVVQALSAAQESDRLPAAWPNYISSIGPEIEETPEPQMELFSEEEVPQTQSWSTWRETTENPDPYLKSPTAYNYQYMHDSVDSFAAWGVTTGKGVTVAVLDSGASANHEDLPNLTRMEVKLGNSSRGLDDPFGHGTHVAGIIGAAMGNGRGGAGIAPDAQLLSLRVVSDAGKSSDAWLIAGLQTAVANGAKIVNISIGSVGYNAAMQKAINDATAKGVTVVAALGNDGTNCLNYPAGYDNVIGVVSVNRANVRAPGSSYGSWADVAAPGDKIMSTSMYGGYVFKSGTSMASPVVAGVAALYLSIHPDATPAQIAARLKATATRGGSDLGAGVVNAAKALSEKPGAPTARIWDRDSEEMLAQYAGRTLMAPWDGVLQLSGNPDKNDYILYTLDGKTPSVKNGQIACGQRYTEPISLSAYSGQTLTVKAMQVSGLGMAGAVLTCRISVQRGTDADKVTVSGPTELLAGKSGEFRAVVTAANPAEPVDQSVTWTIGERSANLAKASIKSSTGVLSTPKLPAGAEGFVEVLAQSKTGQISSEPFRVTVKALNPVVKMSLSSTRVSCYTENAFQLTMTALDAKGRPLTPQVRWTSSNPRVAQVDDSGRVTPLSKGSATITCKALDGSGKYAKCTVTVQQRVKAMTITGLTSLAPGANGTFKAQVSPANAVNKLTWSVKDGPAGTRIINGKLYVPKDAPVGQTITIAAQPPEGGGEGAEYDVRIAPKCYDLWTFIAGVSDYTPVAETYDRSGKLTGLTLYSVEPEEALPGYSGRQDSIYLGADPVDRSGNYLNNWDCITWSSSNPAIAWVDSSGFVQARRAGTVKITAAAQDGSGKKRAVTVKVVNPVSTIALSGSLPKGKMQIENSQDGKTVYWPLLATGCSVTHKAAFATTYGKPTNQKLTWSWQAEDSRGRDCEYLLEKYVSLSSSGRLSISSKALSVIQEFADAGLTIYLTVTARSQDLSGASDSVTYRLVVPARKMYVEKSTVSNGKRGTREIRFYCDQFCQSKGGYDVSNFSITSSNPKVASVSVGSSIAGVPQNPCSPGQDGWYSLLVYSSQTGTARITVKTTDGTNRSCTVTIRCSG